MSAPAMPNPFAVFDGMTVDQIAQYLRDRGIRGHRLQSTACPMAKATGCAVGPRQYVTFSQEGKTYLSEYLPTNVIAFIQAFDSGAYPDLDEDWEPVAESFGDTEPFSDQLERMQDESRSLKD